MHELSIVQALIEQCEELATQNQATTVTKIVIKIGVLSGVEIELLQSAYDTFKEDTICSSAILDIITENLKIHCNNCNTDEEKDEISIVCSKCGSTNVDIIAGEDMFLMSLEMM